MTAKERNIIRDLARQYAALAPEQEEKIRLWKKHNSLQGERPMMMISPEGSWEELVPPAGMEAQDQTARKIERYFKIQLYAAKHFNDDYPFLPIWHVEPVIHSSGWGAEPERIESVGGRGSWHFKPIINSTDDLVKLRLPEYTYDRAETERQYDLYNDLFGDIISVQRSGLRYPDFHPAKFYTDYRGLEPMLMDFYENPDLLHRILRLYTEGMLKLWHFAEDNNLLSYNSDVCYNNGNTFCDELAPPDSPGSATLADMFTWGENQELSEVSPRQHEEFFLPYMRELFAPFAMSGYGCCEPLHNMIDALQRHLPNLRRVNISPFADLKVAAENIGNRYIYSWKPNPSYIAFFDEEAIRQEARQTIEICRHNNCTLDIYLKDTHTCQHDKQRFDRWSEIVRREIERAA